MGESLFQEGKEMKILLIVLLFASLACMESVENISPVEEGRGDVVHSLQPTASVVLQKCYVVTAVVAVNVRKSASVHSSVVDVLYNGKRITVTGSPSGSWLPVPGGWVHKDYVKECE